MWNYGLTAVDLLVFIFAAFKREYDIIISPRPLRSFPCLQRGHVLSGPAARVCWETGRSSPSSARSTTMSPSWISWAACAPRLLHTVWVSQSLDLRPLPRQALNLRQQERKHCRSKAKGHIRLWSLVFSALANNPAYVPYYQSGLTDQMGFFQRLWNTYLKVSYNIIMRVMFKFSERIIHQYLPQSPPTQDILGNLSGMLINMNDAWEYPR